MERLVSPEERIRRAEEIYYRRRNQDTRNSTTSFNISSQNKTTIGKKMIIQILLSIAIYSCFWLVKGYNNVFTNTFINHTKSILNYDVNFAKLYNETVEYLSVNYNSIIKKNEISDNSENINENEQNDQNKNEDNADEGSQNTGEESLIEQNTVEQNTNEITEQSENIIEENNENVQSENAENTNVVNDNDGTIKAKKDSENVDQMQEDAEYIKNNFNIIKPIQGYITSGFGDREQTEIISAFHQGIDIGASQGTPINAAMEGTVVASSYAGEYGNHIKIQNGEVLTVYAHCSELEVKVGDYIKQGQEIGKVGATGKATRTTLTF